MKANSETEYVFGPFNLNLLPAIKIEDLSVKIKSPITHIWGENGVGKSTLMNLIINKCVTQNISFAHINQDYRQNWLWWYDLRKNLSLALNLKSEQKLEDIQEIKDQYSWIGGLLASPSLQVNFASQDENSSINVSGGQLQRLILFREMLRRPKFLFLDEVFSALDRQVIIELASWLLEEQAKYGFKIISISHDPEILSLLVGDKLTLEKDANNTLRVTVF